MGGLDSGLRNLEYPAMNTLSVTSSRAELAVTVWGDSGSPIVALHPGVGDSRIWRWCAPIWAERGHRVVAFDRRGFGETRYEPEPHDSLSDLLAVTAATDSRHAVVVGNSLGGGLALDLALAYPESVAGLILMAPAVTGYPYERWVDFPAEAEQDELIEAASNAGDMDDLNRLETRYWLDGVEQLEGRVEGEPRDVMLDMNGRALRAESPGEDADHPSIFENMGQIDVPALVLCGEYDLPGMDPLCRALASGLPQGQYATIEGAAHCPSLDQPDALNRMVIGFLRSIGY